MSLSRREVLLSRKRSQGNSMRSPSSRGPRRSADTGARHAAVPDHTGGAEVTVGLSSQAVVALGVAACPQYRVPGQPLLLALLGAVPPGVENPAVQPVSERGRRMRAWWIGMVKTCQYLVFFSHRGMVVRR